MGKFSIFEKQGNDQCGWSPERRGEGDVTWSRCGGRSQGWPTFLSLCTAPFSSDVCVQFPGGRICRGVAGLQASALFQVWLRPPSRASQRPVAVWPQCPPSPTVGLQDFLLGARQPLSAETRAVLTQRFREPCFSPPGDLVSSSCTACDLVSQ